MFSFFKSYIFSLLLPDISSERKIYTIFKLASYYIKFVENAYTPVGVPYKKAPF